MYGLTLEEMRNFARQVRAVTKADVQVWRAVRPGGSGADHRSGDLAKVRPL